MQEEEEVEEEEVEEEEKEEAPAIRELDQQMISVGDQALFSCDASGKPKPTIEWLHNGRPVKRDRTDDKEPSVMVEGERLIIRGLRPTVDTVTCSANNSAGTANRTGGLLVYGKNWTAGSDVLQ